LRRSRWPVRESQTNLSQAKVAVWQGQVYPVLFVYLSPKLVPQVKSTEMRAN
jgi:hypothetical protein